MRSRRLWIPLCVCALFSACSRAPDSVADAGPETVLVQRGPLRLVVREGGTLVATHATKIDNKAWERRAIIKLVEEGTFVEKGQLVCELDSEDLEDSLLKHERSVTAARSDARQAEEAVAIQAKQNLESLKSAETTLALAERSHRAYVEGTILLERDKFSSQLTVAREELKRAETEHQASVRLFAGEIIPKTQLEADELGRTKAQEHVVIAQRRLAHFQEFTAPDELKKLASSLEVARIAFERVQQQAASEMAQAEDTLETVRKHLANEVEIYEKIKRHIGYCTIEAPVDGFIVYARRRGWDKEEPISLGRRVWQGENLLRIPDLSEMAVELDIHESSVKRIVRGQRATVTVDALPGESFPARMVKIAPIPSSKSSWMNPDLKVYEADVVLDHEINGARPGMHADVEIVVGEDEDVLQIPLQAVVLSGASPFVYVAHDDRVELRPVVLGPNNEAAVEVLSGLREGERVYLSAPEGAPQLPPPALREFLAPAGDSPVDNGG